METSSANDKVVLERVEFLCDKALFKGKVYRPPDLNFYKGIVIFRYGARGSGYFGVKPLLKIFTKEKFEWLKF